jgi:hypothetical protein
MSALNDLAVSVETGLDEIRGFIAWTNQAPMELAVRLTAAGYRKPRIVTTAEELDALPVGSVVLHNGRAFQHYPAYPAPFDEYQQWKCGDGGFVRSTKGGSSILPATVLYEPEPTP